MSEETPPTISYATPRPSDNWTTVKTYLNPLEAELAATAIRREGIMCQVLGATANATLGIYGTGVAKIDVQVPSEDAESARRLLDAIEEKRRQRMQPKLQCPQCGGEPISRTPKPKLMLWRGMILFLLLVMFLKNQLLCIGSAVCLLLAVFLPITPAWQCKACAHKWRAAEPEDIEDED